MKTILSSVLFVALYFQLGAQQLKPVVDGPQGEKAFKDLGKFYNDGTVVMTDEALAELASTTPEKRISAGKYVYALFAQALADEENGRAPWKQTPYFGGGQECDARKFREEFSKKFGEKAKTNEALDAALWLINKEIIADCQSQGIKVIRRIKTPETNKIIEQIITKPHTNRQILIEAIDEASARKLTEVVPTLETMIHHYRADIREAVKKASVNLKYADKIKPYDPSLAFKNRWLDSMMLSFSAMILEPVPANSYWVEIVYKNKKYPTSSETTFRGWFLGEDTADIEIYDYSLQKIKLTKQDCTVKKSTLEESVKTLNGADAQSEFFHRNFIHANAGNSQLPYLAVASWCYERGNTKATADVLFPLIDNMPDDNWFAWSARDAFGHLYHNEMLLAYSDDRDYAKAIVYATHMSKPLFDGYMYQGRCKLLKKQLESHPDDFKTFKLPSTDEWKLIKTKTKHEEQIVFLADHLRLLNCIQPGQPAGVNYYDEQYDVPTRMVWQMEENEKKKHLVINPYRELQEMELNIADLPVITPYVNSKEYMPTFEYWRNFHHGRTLHQVNWAIAQIITTVTIKDVFDFGNYMAKDSLERIQYMNEFIKWCEQNKNITAKQTIASVIDTSANWDDFSYGMQRALHANYTDLIPSLIKAMDRFKGEDFADKRETIAETVYTFGTAGANEAATKWLTSEEEGLRYYGALILIEQKSDNIKTALETLKPILAKDDGEYRYPKAIRPLVICGLPEALTLAEGILQTPKFLESENFWGYQGTVARRLFLAKSEKALEWLQKGLANKEINKPYSETNNRTILYADDYVNLLYNWREPHLEYESVDWSKEKRFEACSKISDWLKAQFNLLKAGKPHEIVTGFGDLNLPQYYIDAPNR